MISQQLQEKIHQFIISREPEEPYACDDRIEAALLAPDSLMNLAGPASFAADQDALDGRIRDQLG